MELCRLVTVIYQEKNTNTIVSMYFDLDSIMATSAVGVYLSMATEDVLIRG